MPTPAGPTRSRRTIRRAVRERLGHRLTDAQIDLVTQYAVAGPAGFICIPGASRPVACSNPSRFKPTR